MKDRVTTAGVIPGSRAFADERPLVACEKQHLLASPNRVLCREHRSIDLQRVLNNGGGQVLQPSLYGNNFRTVGHGPIDVELFYIQDGINLSAFS